MQCFSPTNQEDFIILKWSQWTNEAAKDTFQYFVFGVGFIGNPEMSGKILWRRRRIYAGNWCCWQTTDMWLVSALTISNAWLVHFVEIRWLLRWPNTVFQTCVSCIFFSKTLEPLVTKSGSKQVYNTNFSFLMDKLTYVPLPWQYE